MLIDLISLDDNPYELEEFVNGLNLFSGNTGFRARGYLTPQEFKKQMKIRAPNVAVLDIELSDHETTGFEICKWVRTHYPDTLVLMRSRLDDAVALRTALDAGAFDYLLKNLSVDGIAFRIQKAWDFFCSINRPAPVLDSVGVGKTMRQIEAKVERILGSSIRSVHIYGETGTGKEVVSDIFCHRQKKPAPFVRVNCGSLHPELMYSQLFGHVKGAFTGAAAEHAGLFESASGGIIFLDEIALLSDSAQKGLLRVLENQEVLRLGAAKPSKISIFLLSATNEDLTKLVTEGKFRQDLLQRLGETTIELPPLRDRLDEVNELIDHFLLGLPGGPYHVDESIRTLLNNYHWSEGNARQLRNCLKALSEFHFGGQLTVMGAPRYLFQGEQAQQKNEPPSEDFSSSTFKFPLNFGAECDRLLVKMILELYKQRGALSMRGLALETAIPRTTLKSKLSNLIDSGHFTKADLDRMIKS